MPSFFRPQVAVLSNFMIIFNDARLISVAEDIEHFNQWWKDPNSLTNAAIRHGSAILRRLLVEDAAGIAWRQIGFSKSLKLYGPNLPESFKRRSIEINLVVSAVAAGVKFGGINCAFLGAYRAHNPATGILATADSGFALIHTSAMRRADKKEPSELDALIEYEWYLPNYLKAPGLIRMGQVIERRQIIKHMANEMGGVHIGNDDADNFRDLLVESESKLFIKNKAGWELRTFYIETLAIGQAVAQSSDFLKLATTIRKKL